MKAYGFPLGKGALLPGDVYGDCCLEDGTLLGGHYSSNMYFLESDLKWKLKNAPKGTEYVFEPEFENLPQAIKDNYQHSPREGSES